MVVEPLLLNNNEYAISLLEEVGRSNVRNAKHAAIVQNAAIYYQCLVTKRQAGTMSFCIVPAWRLVTRHWW